MVSNEKDSDGAFAWLAQLLQTSFATIGHIARTFRNAGPGEIPLIVEPLSVRLVTGG